MGEGLESSWAGLLLIVGEDLGIERRGERVGDDAGVLGTRSFPSFLKRAIGGRYSQSDCQGLCDGVFVCVCVCVWGGGGGGGGGREILYNHDCYIYSHYITQKTGSCSYAIPHLYLLNVRDLKMDEIRLSGHLCGERACACVYVCM